MSRLFFLLTLWLFSSCAFAHKDRIITLEAGGDLSGLPSQYLPAQLDLSAKRLVIGKHSLLMPPCVARYFLEPNSYKLSVTASWYHSRSVLPPYIGFRISPIEKDFEYNLLFNMEDLSPIEFSIITHPNDMIINHNELAIPEFCRSAIEKATTKVKVD